MYSAMPTTPRSTALLPPNPHVHARRRPLDAPVTRWRSSNWYKRWPTPVQESAAAPPGPSARAVPKARQNPLSASCLDGASDIRSEAAEALGHLRQPTSIDPLVDALDDADSQVRISAIRGLASIRGEEVHELLFWHFGSDFDPLTFPTLVDVLGERQDRRIVKPALRHLVDFPSPAVRLQLLNGVCRALGTGDQFYRLLSRDDNDRVAIITRLLKRATTALVSARCIEQAHHARLGELCSGLVLAYEEDKAEEMVETMKKIVITVRDGLSGSGEQAHEVLSIYVVLIAINNFINNPTISDSPIAQEIFLVVCLQRMAGLIGEIDKRA